MTDQRNLSPLDALLFVDDIDNAAFQHHLGAAMRELGGLDGGYASLHFTPEQWRDTVTRADIVRQWLCSEFPEGTRVTFTDAWDVYPHFIVPKGAMGVVVEADGDIWVEVDERIPGCETWDNRVAFYWDVTMPPIRRTVD